MRKTYYKYILDWKLLVTKKNYTNVDYVRHILFNVVSNV